MQMLITEVTMKQILLLGIVWVVVSPWHWKNNIKKEGNNPYGLIQSETFGAPAISGNFSGPDPNRIRWAGGPISALDFNSTTATYTIIQTKV